MSQSGQIQLTEATEELVKELFLNVIKLNRPEFTVFCDVSAHCECFELTCYPGGWADNRELDLEGYFYSPLSDENLPYKFKIYYSTDTEKEFESELKECLEWLTRFSSEYETGMKQHKQEREKYTKELELKKLEELKAKYEN